jgi:non-heme chloroperoxidase
LVIPPPLALLILDRQIKGSQFEVFEEAEGGQHFMFIENPEKFNRLIIKYLG